MKNFTFYISGTHCSSCKIFIEDSLKDIDYVKDVVFDLKDKTLKINTRVDKNLDRTLEDIRKVIEPRGYTILKGKKEAGKSEDNDIWLALPIGLTIIILFFILQRSGILNIGIGGRITPTTSFIIGLIASVSSCLAIVGGLVLSLSAKISQDDVKDTKTFLLFHVARLVTFAILGGILGSIGSAIGINFTLTAIIGLIASFVMIILGLNLVGLFERNKITLPSSLFKFFSNIKFSVFTPVILGFATFFLPCGFTQSMQIAALSSGSFMSGLLIMLTFSLGTLPVLAFLSFGSTPLSKNKYSGVFFKSSGIVVICLGLFALLSGLVSLGVINPLFNI